VEVHLASGAILPADLVILSIGVKPDTRLARDAGIETDERGYIVVDDHLRTSAPWIWAVGDAIVSKNPLTGKPQPVPLAGPANKQARIAAENIVRGPSRTWKGAIGTSVAKVFDLTVAATGLSEKACRRDGIACQSAIVHPGSHAGYYPDAHPYALKLVWSPDTGRILGAQAVGRDGVDKRIDVVAAHIGMGATVHQLAEFEHAYAPPYASAKDGTNYAAFVAVNALDGLTRLASWSEVQALADAGAFLLDARTPAEFELGAIPGAVNIPHTELRERLAEVPRDREVVVYCAVGLRGYLAERVLRENGFGRVRNLTGGWRTWKSATDPQQNLEASVAVPTEVAAEAAFSEGSGVPESVAPPPVATEIVVDACGLQCPGPVIRLKETVDSVAAGSRIAVTATDPGFARDAGAWCNITGHRLVSVVESKGRWTATIEKASKAPAAPVSMPGMRVSGDEVTLIVFSNDLDRALASFVIANGALATGKKVTMFFTFWGLSVVRRRSGPKVRKDFMGRMFDLMLPRHAASLGLSRMNFGGIGAVLMKRRMEAFQVDRLEEMMESARRAGVRMTACQMSMELMGVAPQELMDGVDVGGVATYLEAAGTSGINLFV
jgi:peroxiredoxin family protein/rhodanese-related sulfurtransferase/TusA-related sulfurtransferase